MTAADRIGSLVNHQMRRWELQHGDAERQPRSPSIAFSRLAGSGGAAIAHKVAEWLDYGFFGSEIVTEIARQHHVQVQLVQGLDERVRNVIDRYVTDAFQEHPFTESEYLEHLVRTVATLGQRGMAVLLGRGSPFILPATQALRIYVIAPLEIRVERAAAERGLGAADTRAALEREDGERREFIRHHFGRDQDDPLAYDLVINSADLGTEAAASIVVETLRRRFPAPARAAAR